MSNKFLFLTISILIFSLIAGCASWSKTQKGAAIGAATGATAGAFIDHHKRARGAAIGAAVGGLAGAYAGKQEDRADENRRNNEEMRDALYQAEEENRRREEELRASIGDESRRIEEESRRREEEAFASSFKQVILFDYDSYRVTEGAFSDIRYAAGLLNKYPYLPVLVKGYADTSGSSEYNLSLSRSRASAVKEALIRSGVEQQRISVEAQGEWEYSRSSLGRQMSRRVEITVDNK